MKATDQEKRIDVDKPLWDVTTFYGRFRHFLWVTDFRTCFVTDKTLDNAKELLENYRNNKEPPGTTQKEILYAKKLFESAFHPDTHEKSIVFGRMSFQVPGNMVITGLMLQFYKTIAEVIFLQWFNQSFNACVNYTNRNAKTILTNSQIGVAYVCATTSALVTAIALKRSLRNARPIFQRFVPFAAVSASNCFNIPLMRVNEIRQGIELSDANGKSVNVRSSIAAVKGISQVILSRIAMCAPVMLTFPIIMQRLEQAAFMQNKIISVVSQLLLVGAFLTITTPFGCAIFPQTCSIQSSTIKRFEPDSYTKFTKQFDEATRPKTLYFNKGL